MTITHDTTHIYISGTETGDALRTYITSNSLGTVITRTTTIERNLRLNSLASLTDVDCTWIFPSTYHLDSTAKGALFEVVDGVIIYTGGAKGHTSQLRANTIRFTNVQFRIEGGTGRTDYFSNATSGFEFDNVQFISYGGSNFMHLATGGGLLENVAMLVKSGSFTFQPDASPGNTLILRNWVLSGITYIIANGNSNITGVTRLENLDWDATQWSIGSFSRGQTYKVINPKKPAGWTGYKGSKNLSVAITNEFHTHNLRVVDESNTPLSGYKVQLRRSDNTTLVYDLTTDVNGDIAEQEVLTFEQTGTDTDFTQYSNFLLSGISYNNNIISGTKALQDGRIDETTLAPTDTLLTEATKTTVDAYTAIETSAKIYDRAKSYLVDNFAGETETLVEKIGALIDLGSRDLTIDATAASAFAIDGSGNITIKATTFTGDITTTGTVTLSNGATVSGTIIDSTADSSLVFSGIDSWEAYSSQANANTQTSELGSGTGSENYRFNYSANTTYYLRLTVGADTIFKVVTPTAAGVTSVTLETASILTGVDSKLGFIEKITYLDTTASVNGTGANTSPFSSTDSAVTKARADNAKFISILDSTPSLPVQPTASCASVNFTGKNKTEAYLDPNGQDFTDCELSNLKLSGNFSSSTGEMKINDVYFNGAVTNINGELHDCIIEHDVTFNGKSQVENAHINSAGANPKINVDAGVNIVLDNVTGSFDVNNVPANSSVSIYAQAQTQVTLTSNCVGFVFIRGSYNLTDSSGGAAIIIADQQARESTINSLNNLSANDIMGATIEGSHTLKECMRLQNAVLLGKVSGAGSGSEIFRDIDDNKDRVIATVDAVGNRTSITLDES